MLFAVKLYPIFLMCIAVNFIHSFPVYEADAEEPALDVQTLEKEAANEDYDEPIDNSAKLAPDEDEAQLRDRRIAVVPFMRGVQMGMRLYCRWKEC